jgi:MFS family permease
MYQENRVRDLRERSFGELLGELSSQTSQLIRDEIQLARVEMTEKAKETGTAVGIMAAGGAVALLALGVLSAFFVLVLDEVMPSWLAALIVFAVYAAIAAVLFFVGRARLREASPPTPEETVQTLRDDVRWAKRQLD